MLKRHSAPEEERLSFWAQEKDKNIDSDTQLLQMPKESRTKGKVDLTLPIVS